MEAWDESSGAGAPWPRMLAIFGGAVVVRLATQIPLWAYDRGLLGPRDAGQRILLGLPLAAVRLLKEASLVIAVYSGGNLLAEARRRWGAYQDEIRGLAPQPPGVRPGPRRPAPEAGGRLRAAAPGGAAGSAGGAESQQDARRAR